MCGIAGIVNFEQTPICTSLLTRMCDEIRHRGPDDEGYSLYDGKISLYGGEDTSKELMLPHISEAPSSYAVGFGFRRLSIVDLSVSGHQPMVSQGKRFMMVFNGEIYNYKDLRKDLESNGMIFSSDSDSEVVLNAYLKWGKNCVKRFNGMWSICIFDSKEKSLFCSRDRFGIKPLYYHKNNKSFFFASEIKQLLLNKEVTRTLDEEASYNYLVNGIKDYSDKTMFKDICQLEPGCNLILSNGEFKIEKYWDFSVNNSYETSDDLQETEKNFLKLFTSAVQLRLKADVPVGVALSGGIDSSSTAVVANEISNSPLMTFSVVFDEEKYDERYFSTIVANKISCVRHEVKPDIAVFIKEIDEFIAHMEEPTKSISTYSQWCLMRNVKKGGITVLLEGQGADELLGGYEWYFDSFFSDIFKIKSLFYFISELISYKKNYHLSFYAVLIKALKAHNYIKLLKRKKIEGVFNSEVICNLTPICSTGVESLFSSQLDFGLRFQVRELLNYGDKSSMKFSVENRVPFLDYRLVEYATQLPLSSKIKNGDTKNILRKALSKLLPNEISKRYSKLGYASPQELWQRNELKSEIEKTVFDSCLFDLKIFNTNHAISYFKDYYLYKHNDYSFIWRCYNFAKWLKCYDVVIPENLLRA
jgi:asparagine synthase (glutamine-hydrolysing)